MNGEQLFALRKKRQYDMSSLSKGTGIGVKVLQQIESNVMDANAEQSSAIERFFSTRPVGTCTRPKRCKVSRKVKIKEPEFIHPPSTVSVQSTGEEDSGFGLMQVLSEEIPNISLADALRLAKKLETKLK